MDFPLLAKAQAARAAPKAVAATCHSAVRQDTRGLPLVVLVGSPNVGKSVLFNILTGIYVTVSNYPGTTVEVARGRGRIAGIEAAVVDTPGMYRLLPITQEERVAREILLTERPAVVIHVVDAKNLSRMLPMTLQLIEAGLPVMLAINFMDEAERLGVKVEAAKLEQALGVPVVPTAAALGRGGEQLRRAIAARLAQPQPAHCCAAPRPHVTYPPLVETAAGQVEERLTSAYGLERRALALLLLEQDAQVAAQVAAQEGSKAQDIEQMVQSAQARSSQPLGYAIARARQAAAQQLLDGVVTLPGRHTSDFAERLSRAMITPLTGLPLLALGLTALYVFVGVFGAQTLVAFFEQQIFGAWINPWAERALGALVPWQIIRDLLGGPYGIITLGVRYAVAIILPIVGTFFIAFSIIEDSGYLPRLAMLVDRTMKPLGLNGRAVIPLVLGFGCDTMATIITRTLETPRERLLSTILLSLAIPCSAQLGVMLALLGGHPALLAIWALIVVGVLLLVGLLAARVMPGERPAFYMELPPLRWPNPANVLVKTYTRMEWYLREVLPMFILASVVIWLGRLTGLFDLAIQGLTPFVRWLGLPDAAAVSFLFGFFRRDYGAAGLYDLQASMTPVQILVATVTMTLFVPCIAQFSVTAKERGWKTALAIAAFIFPFAFLVGAALNWLLCVLGVTV